MRELTKAEEQIMQILWSLGNGTVSDVREQFEEPRPARTTVATVLTILENKGFLSHTSDDRSNLYTPLITKKEYSHTQLFGMMRNYFDGSFASMASFFARESNLSASELDRLLKDTQRELEEEQS